MRFSNYLLVTGLIAFTSASPAPAPAPEPTTPTAAYVLTYPPFLT